MATNINYHLKISFTILMSLLLLRCSVTDPVNNNSNTTQNEECWTRHGTLTFGVYYTEPFKGSIYIPGATVCFEEEWLAQQCNTTNTSGKASYQFNYNECKIAGNTTKEIQINISAPGFLGDYKKVNFTGTNSYYDEIELFKRQN